MPERISTFALLLFSLLVGAGVLIYVLLLPATLETKIATEDPSSPTLRSNRNPGFDDGSSTQRRGAFDAMTAALELAELKQLLNQPGAIDGEAILRFNHTDAYRRFLAAAANAGLQILNTDAGNNALRLGFDDYATLLAGLSDYDDSEYSIGANFIVSIPTIPAPDSPDNPGQVLRAFGPGALDYLGVSNNTGWGQGITVAVLDTGIAPIFPEGQIIPVDFLGTGETLAENLGHGTAVASIITQVVEGSTILSFAVVGESGTSTSFELAQAIDAATAQGVDVINISLGSSGNSVYVMQAVANASAAGVAVVAAAGNEGQDNRLAFPAANEGTIGTAANDLLGQVTYYSNSSDNLSLTAPGVGIQVAAPDGTSTLFDGTSAAAPFVTAGIAAILWDDPSLSAQEAEALLYEHANEAGRPGFDPEYGHGILDIGGALQRNTPGIYDVATASQTFADPSIPTNNANPFIDIAVENRGTETLYNVSVQVSSPGILRNFNIPVLAPNEVTVLQAPIDTAIARTDGSLQVVATANISAPNTVDANRNDNRQTTSVNVVAPATPTNPGTTFPRASGGIQ